MHGRGAILLDNCVIEPWALVGAGALVPEGRRIPSGSLAVGVPARVIRRLTDAELERIRHGHAEYMRLAADYRREYVK